MIPIATIRAAHRVKTVNRIKAWPSAARFIRFQATTGTELSVRTSEPKQTRELKLGGFQVAVELQCEIALACGADKPEAEKDRIDIQDLAGEWRTYVIVTVTATEGLDCYLLGLRTNRTKPTSSLPSVFPRL